MQVRVNGLYEYQPCGWDLWSPCTGNTLKPGEIVRVIELNSAPKANTMGQCYVGCPSTGQFWCMVSTSSLVKVQKIGIRKYERKNNANTRRKLS